MDEGGLPGIIAIKLFILVTDKSVCYSLSLSTNKRTQAISMTRLGDLLDFGQLFKAFGKN